MGGLNTRAEGAWSLLNAPKQQQVLTSACKNTQNSIKQGERPSPTSRGPEGAPSYSSGLFLGLNLVITPEAVVPPPAQPPHSLLETSFRILEEPVMDGEL